MDRRHQEILTRLSPLIQQHLQTDGGVWRILCSQGILDDATTVAIGNEKSVPTQVQTLMASAKSKGNEAYLKLISSMQKSGNNGIAKVLQQAQDMYQENSTPATASRIQGFVNSHMTINRPVRVEDRQLLMEKLVLRDDFVRELNSKMVAEDRLMELTFQIHTLEAKNTELQNKLATANSVIKRCQGEKQDKDNEIAGLKMTVDGKNEAIEELREQLQREQKTIRDLLSKTQDEMIHDLEMEVMGLQGDVKQLNQRIELERAERDAEQQSNRSYVREMNSLMEVSFTNGRTNNKNGILHVEASEDVTPMDVLKRNVETICTQYITIQNTLKYVQDDLNSMKQEEQACLDMLQDSEYSEESSLREVLKTYLENSSRRISKLEHRLATLQERLKLVIEEKMQLQFQLENSMLDKEVLRNGMDVMKRKVLDTKFGVLHNSSHEQGNIIHYQKDDDQELRFRLPAISRSTSAAGVLQLGVPHVRNVTIKENTSVSLSKDKSPLSPRPAPRKSPTTDGLNRCMVCNSEYSEEDNHDAACSFHTKPYKSLSGPKAGKFWQCCFRSSETASGCSYGRHRCK